MRQSVITYLFLLIYLCFYLELIHSNCPRFCTGHGQCQSSGACECYSPYTAAPDCSLQTCPYDFAWSGKSYNSTPHRKAECSNAGICDRSTGICQCFPGYVGHACQRSSCDCMNGRCVTIGNLYESYTIDQNYTSFQSWESNHTTSCICDVGYFGAACEYRMCPKGYDPLKSFTDYRSFMISILPIDATINSISGYLKFRFQGYSFVFPANSYSWSREACETAFATLPNIKTASCSINEQSATGAANITVKVISYSTIPYENNIYHHTGNPSLSDFSCDVPSSYDAYNSITASCSLSNLPVDVLPSYTYCSNRGSCNFTTGICACYDHFHGANCDSYLYNDHFYRDLYTYDIYTLYNKDRLYDGKMLYLSSSIIQSSQYNMLRLSDISRRYVFHVDGTGAVVLGYGGLHIYEGGQTIMSGGLAVSGGITITSGGLKINDGNLIVSNGDISIPSRGLGIYGGLTVTSSGIFIKQNDLILADTGFSNQNGEVHVYHGANIYAGGLNLGSSSLSILSTGLCITGGVTLWSPLGMRVTGGVTVMSGGINFAQALSVLSGGIFISNGLTISNGDLLVTGGGISILSGNVRVTGGLTLQGGDVVVNDGITIQSGGMIISGGITVQASGLSVMSGGLTIGGDLSVHGLYINDGVTISSSGVAVDSLTIKSGGLQVNNGITVQAGMIAYGGLSVSGGMMVSNGMSIDNEGLRIKKGAMTVIGNAAVVDGVKLTTWKMFAMNGMTVYSGGMVVKKRLQVTSNGLMINGGISSSSSTSSAGKLSITGGLTLASGGLVVDDGLAVRSGGWSMPLSPITINSGGIRSAGAIIVPSIFISGGMTVTGTVAWSGGMTVRAGGWYSNGGLTVYDLNVGKNLYGIGGLVSSGPMTVSAGGMQVTGGLTITSSGATFNALSITSQGLAITAATTITAGGLHVDGGVIINAIGAVIGQGISQSYGSLYMTGDVTIRSGGLVVDGPGRFAGNMLITGGLSILSDATRIKGLTIHSGGLAVSSGVTITGNMIVTPGLTIASGGMNAFNGGITTISSGAYISQGLSVSGSLSINQGLFITSGGLAVSQGVSITGQVVLTGGITLTSPGLYSGRGIIISTGGALVDQQLSSTTNFRSSQPVIIQGAGASIQGGITVQDTGLSVTGNGMTVASGIIITNGVTVEWRGMYVSGGMTVSGTAHLQTAPVTSSDQRLKSNITEINMQGALESINQLRGVYYSWKEVHTPSTRGRQLGIIAQDVLSIFPEAVHGMLDDGSIGEDQYLSVSHDMLIPLLTQAIRELDRLVTIQEEKASRYEHYEREYEALLVTHHSLLDKVQQLLV